MGSICQTCGLPKEICACQEIAKEGGKIKIKTEKKRYQKTMTIVEGFDPDVDLGKLAKELKQKLACGGTSKHGRIELQGDHKERIKEILLKKNYSEAQIDVF